MSIKSRILLVDDESQILSSLKRVLRLLEMDVVTAESGAAALEILANQAVDIMLTDLNMPGMTGIELCQQVAEKYPETIRIMLTAHTDIEHILDAINSGRVWGYLQKPWDNQQLLILIKQALRDQLVMAERSLLRNMLSRYQKRRKKDFAGFIGDSVAMQFTYNLIEKAAPSSAPVFITGESGTGKEVAASAIHQLSKRKNDPFIALNCAAIPGELMESEIFGHVKGAFSGAANNRDGAATLAHEGTLFLDELGEMDINLQAKLLRFIQTGTFQKVGSSKLEKVDIRFVCATNRDPLEAIAQGKLREDLYYRLNVISIDLPALKERDDDPLQIATHFMKRFAAEEEKEFVGFSSDAECLIRNYDWPGNVRQLINAIQSSVIMSDGPLVNAKILASQLKLSDADYQRLSVARSKATLSLDDDFPSADIEINAPAVSETDGPVQETVPSEEDILPLALVERRAIEQAIAFYGDNIVKAAGALGVSPSTLYRKIQQWQG